MPQAYLVLCGKTSRKYLIAKKRVTSKKFDGQYLTNPQLVNAAGQYALPGGGFNQAKDHDAEAAAFREFAEETGVKLSQQISTEKYEKKPYSFFVLEVDDKDLENICKEASENVRPDARDPLKPQNRRLKSFEMEGFFLVDPKDISNYLGNYQEIPAEKKPRSYNRSHHTQAINWYGQIAQAIKEREETKRSSDQNNNSNQARSDSAAAAAAASSASAAAASSSSSAAAAAASAKEP